MTSLQIDQNVIYTIAEGKLEDQDYKRMIPLLQEKVRSFGKIRWYFEMRDFKGWSLSAMWQDLKIDFEIRNNLERIAMVGDKIWEKELAQLMKPFTDAEIKYFEIEDREEAKYWIKKISNDN